MSNFLKNILTFGASGRIEDAVESYEYSIESLSKLHKKVEEARVQANVNLESLIKSKKYALLSLRKIRKISKTLTPKERDLVGEEAVAKIDNSFKSINQTITVGEFAMNSAKGAGIGVSTAMGAWALAGTFGTASTGIGISALAGSAATNATLAYLGGGALAVGGGGMAAGTAVLGGMFALPALLLTGVFSHIAANKKIKEIEEKQYEVIKAQGACEEALVIFDLINQRSNEITIAVDKARESFEIELDKVYHAIYPRFYSRFIKAVRKIFTGKYFNGTDLDNIKYIGGVATSMAMLIDQVIIDENGKPV